MVGMNKMAGRIWARVRGWLLTGCLGVAMLAAASPPAAPANAASPKRQEAGGSPASPVRSLSDAEIQEIIRKFAAKESEFRRARDNYTYHQIVKVQELSPEGVPGGTYHVESDIIFTPGGARVEKVTYAPPSTLRRIGITPEDERDLKSIQPFVLTTEDLPKYNIQYQGRQKVDELSTLVFRVGPKQLVKGERYFEGLVWVDDRDFQIVKTYGKAVPDIRRGGYENLAPRFETYREQIDGKYWFPTWTGADDTLYFSNGPQRIRMIVRYENYKQFKTDTVITYGDEAETPPQVQ